VPTKALVHHSGKRPANDSTQERYERAVGDVQAPTALFRGGNFDALNGADTVTVVTGRATFIDRTPSASERAVIVSRSTPRSS